MTAPDPEKGWVAFLRTLEGVTSNTVKTDVDTDEVVVHLTPGVVTEKAGWIDRARVDLVCYGPDPLALAMRVRTAALNGFEAAGQRCRRVAADPPYPLNDPITNELRYYLGTTASFFAVPS